MMTMTTRDRAMTTLLPASLEAEFLEDVTVS